MPRAKKGREAILKAAGAEFYKNGFKATGVEAIAKAAGVTKATLYHYFLNKDVLIEEVLEHLSSFHKSGYIRAWSKKGLKPEQRLTVLFDEMGAFFKEEECRGCPFINAASEYTERDSPVRRICEAHYQYIANELEKFAREAKLKQPKKVAEQISSLIAGGYTAWLVGNYKHAARQGKLLAEMIIARHA